MPQTPKQKIGAWGEEQAVQFLRSAGVEIAERNFRVKQGEIDIIGWRDLPPYGRTLCFIEVKTRSSHLESAERATGKEKLDRLFRAARAYCLFHDINTDRTPIQFEQVSVYVTDMNEQPILRHFVIPVD